MFFLPLLAALTFAAASAPLAPGSADASTTSSAPVGERALLLVLDVEAEHLPVQDRAGLGEAVTLAFARRVDVNVQSMKALAARAQLGAEQQAVGCDTSTCLAEIANAMGARYVAYTRVVRLGDIHLMRVDVFDNTTSQSIALASQQGSLSTLFAGTTRLVDALLAAGALPLLAQRVDVPATALTVAGAGVVGVGVVLGIVAVVSWNALGPATDTWGAAPTSANADAMVKAIAGAEQTVPLAVVGSMLGVAGAVATAFGAFLLTDGVDP